MMGRTHAISGAAVWLAGCAISAAVGATPAPATVAVGAVVAAGSALLPDLDHPASHAARTFGPATGLLARASAWVCARVHAATRVRCRRGCERVGCRSCPDRVDSDGHRTLAHTAVVCLSLGVGVGAVSWIGGVVAAATVAAVTAMLAGRALLRPGQRRWVGALLTDLVAPAHRRRGPMGRSAVRVWRRLLWRFGPASGLVVIGAAAAGAVWQLGPGAWWWLGVPVTVGALTHLAGDACTNSGCPILWPIRVRGRRWYPVGTPRLVRFDTGSITETFVFWALAGAGALSLYVLAA